MHKGDILNEFFLSNALPITITGHWTQLVEARILLLKHFFNVMLIHVLWPVWLFCVIKRKWFLLLLYFDNFECLNRCSVDTCTLTNYNRHNTLFWITDPKETRTSDYWQQTQILNQLTYSHLIMIPIIYILAKYFCIPWFLSRINKIVHLGT